MQNHLIKIDKKGHSRSEVPVPDENIANITCDGGLAVESSVALQTIFTKIITNLRGMKLGRYLHLYFFVVCTEVPMYTK